MSRRVAVAGGHGQIAMLLHPLLAARGDEVLAVIRTPEHVGDVEAAGARAVLFDIEAGSSNELASAIGDVDAVVFAAGAGPGSGAARKWTVDRDGAIKLLEAAGGARYVMVSAMGARTEPPQPSEGDVWATYMRAKWEADAAVMASSLPWTIVRPGRLTDDPPTGHVAVDEQLPRGDIPRADVAAVLAAVLADDRLVGTRFDLVSGDQPIEAALSSLRASRS